MFGSSFTSDLQYLLTQFLVLILPSVQALCVLFEALKQSSISFANKCRYVPWLQFDVTWLFIPDHYVLPMSFLRAWTILTGCQLPLHPQGALNICTYVQQLYYEVTAFLLDPAKVLNQWFMPINNLGVDKRLFIFVLVLKFWSWLHTS